MQKWVITQSDLERWLKPEVYHIYTKKHDELYLQDTQRFNQRFKDDRDFFISFFKNCLYYTKPEDVDDFYKNPTNQKNFILKHFSMKTLNNRTIKYKDIKIDNDLIREFMQVRYNYDTESIVRDQRSRSKDDEYSM